MKTVYQVANDDGTVDRFIVETVLIGRFVRAFQYICADGTWIPIRSVSECTLAEKRKPENTEMLFHSKTRRGLRKRFKSRLEFNSSMSTTL